MKFSKKLETLNLIVDEDNNIDLDTTFIHNFLLECCEFGNYSRVSSKVLWLAFEKWMIDINFNSGVNKQNFSKKLSKLLMRSSNLKGYYTGASMWKGFTVKTKFMQESLF